MALFKRALDHLWSLHNQKLLQQSRLQVETNLTALTEVLEWFEQFTEPLLPQRFRWQCQIVLVEGFTNAVRHAHQHLPPTTLIELELSVFTHCFEMRIWDWGEPFDLHAKLHSLCQENHNPLDKEGGRGLMFMQQLTDELCYQRLPDGRNCLLMRKHC